MIESKIQNWLLVAILILYSVTGLILFTAGNVASFMMGLYLLGGGLLLYITVRILRVLERLENGFSKQDKSHLEQGEQ